MYTWSTGRSPCEEDVLPHDDPHSHIADPSDWTHVATAYPLELEGDRPT